MSGVARADNIPGKLAGKYVVTRKLAAIARGPGGTVRIAEKIPDNVVVSRPGLHIKSETVRDGRDRGAIRFPKKIQATGAAVASSSETKYAWCSLSADAKLCSQGLSVAI